MAFGMVCTTTGRRVELRHCVDYIYVGNALANDLALDMRREMTDFVKTRASHARLECAR